jgi:hypothetical protein
MNITPRSLIDFKEFARDVRRSEAESPALSEVGGDLQFYRPVLEMFFDGVLMQVEVKMYRAYGACTVLGNPMSQPFRAGLTFGGRPLRQAQGRLYGPQGAQTASSKNISRTGL